MSLYIILCVVIFQSVFLNRSLHGRMVFIDLGTNFCSSFDLIFYIELSSYTNPITTLTILVINQARESISRRRIISKMIIYLRVSIYFNDRYFMFLTLL